jgi:hypothetical protein
MDPPGLGEISDGTQTASLDVLRVHLSVPECFCRESYEGVTLSFKYVRQTI